MMADKLLVNCNMGALILANITVPSGIVDVLINFNPFDTTFNNSLTGIVAGIPFGPIPLTTQYCLQVK
jgi:hypothetical protein